MNEREGFRQILIAESVYQDFERRRKELEAAPTPVAAARRASGNCGMDVIFGPDGEIRSMSCGGSCGFIDWILGRRCMIRSEKTPNGGARFFCSCGGGWFDRLVLGR